MKMTKVPTEKWNSLIANGNTPEDLYKLGLEPAFSGTHEGRLLQVINDKLQQLDKKKDADSIAKLEAVLSNVELRQKTEKQLNDSIRQCGDDLKVDYEVTETNEQTGKKEVVETRRVFPKYDNKVVVKG
tara:strand:+ start:3128 stop:3514 length:387 start_codon:yes stop_codon:yes gene_type:complete